MLDQARLRLRRGRLFVRCFMQFIQSRSPSRTWSGSSASKVYVIWLHEESRCPPNGQGKTLMDGCSSTKFGLHSYKHHKSSVQHNFGCLQFCSVLPCFACGAGLLYLVCNSPIFSTTISTPESKTRGWLCLRPLPGPPSAPPVAPAVSQ